ncbi:MAG: ATPase, T2SS/T4P/T4SS family [Acetivibrio sp.]
MISGLLVIISLFGIGCLYHQMQKKSREIQKEENEILYSLEYLTKEIKDCFTSMMTQKLSRLNVCEEEMEKRKKNRSLLRRALQNCAYADEGAKAFVKDYIKQFLQRKYEVSEENIQWILPFEDYEKLTLRDKFDILLYTYRVKKQKGAGAMESLLRDYHLDGLRKGEDEKKRYEVTAEDIEEIYKQEVRGLTYGDKLEIVAQRIFSMDKGNGVIDDLIYQNLDGVSAGVSQIPCKNYEAITIMYQGKSISLSALSFESEKELKRICKKIYKYDVPGEMSESSGFMVNRLKSGARISSMRPPFSDAWCFWIRMFDSVDKRSILSLYPQEGKEKLHNLLKLLIRGEQTCVISGQQGSGKTTCLEAMVDFIRPTYNIRTIELTFELQLRERYPTKNIAAMRETESVTTEQAMEFVKKTDADVVIFGEIAKETEGEKVIKLSQSGSRFSISTHHSTNTRNLINWFRNALLKTSGFQNEEIAETQVVENIRFDIHLDKSEDGTRFVERITEIVPLEKGGYEERILLTYKEGIYVISNRISKQTTKAMVKCLTKEEIEMYEKYLEVED